MKISLDDWISVILFSDPEKNIVIFTQGEGVMNDKEDGKSYGKYPVITQAIELKFPYTQDELADKIELAVSLFGVYTAGELSTEKKECYEAKYFGAKDFKSAVKGKKYFRIGWNVYCGVYVDFMLPFKSVYAYYGMKSYKLTVDATAMDFAKVVMEAMDTDLSEFANYKLHKPKFNV